MLAKTLIALELSSYKVLCAIGKREKRGGGGGGGERGEKKDER